MKVGFLTSYKLEELAWAGEHDLESFELVGFEASPLAKDSDWKPAADRLRETAAKSGLKLSCIGALYANPVAPNQSEFGLVTFKRAVDVAAYLKVKTVAGFPGAPIHVKKAEWGGHTVYEPFEDHLKEFRAFWEPVARYAKDKGVRIAFEHCAAGIYHQPVQSFNIMGRIGMWEKVFNELPDNVGLEWDASHLQCQFIDPIDNIHKYGRRIFHVHAKDAYINSTLLRQYGICHHGVAEHRFPGMGQANWAEIVHALLRAGYDSDLNIEGWHDPIWRDHGADQPADVKSHGVDHQAGQKLEKAGVINAVRFLKQFTAGTE